MDSDINFFILEELPKEITEEDLAKFFDAKLKISSIEIFEEDSQTKAKMHYDKSTVGDLTILDELENQLIPGTNAKVKISFDKKKFFTATAGNPVLNARDIKENEKIEYNMPYHEHVLTQFIKAPGDTELKFIDQKVIDKQRGILKHLLTKMGSNLLSGSGIMNVSLPINIFDERSLLEVFAHQCRLSPYFFEKAAEAEEPIEKLKYSTAFAISRIHLSVTQLKPFNPIWGETFQCKIGDTSLYMEQTSHHPPIYHFLHLGKNFKSYGYQEPHASTGANSVLSRTKGVQVLEFSDGTKHLIFPCTLSLTGTLVGDRTYAIIEKFYVVDEKNDYIAYIEFNPDDRGALSKLFTKQKTFPDYFRGCITRLSQTTFNPKDNQYTLNKNYTAFVNIEGEWTRNCMFDDETYWDYNEFTHYDLLRMAYTLPSDSTLREDLVVLKTGNEEEATKAKVALEEIQRNDRKLRAQYDKYQK